MTNLVGERVSQFNLNPPHPDELSVAARELIVQADGGHIATKDPDKRSFEALSGIVYRPSCLAIIDEHHRQITDKSCAISALDDRLVTMKLYLHHAAIKQGLTAQTQVTALADGASNCWSVILALSRIAKALNRY